MLRLGKNKDGYFGETIDIRAVLREVEIAAPKHGWTSEIFHDTGEFELIALHRQSTLNSQLVFTSAPAFTATSLPGRSRRCACFRKTNGRRTSNYGSARA